VAEAAFRWPKLPDGSQPAWTGAGFEAGGQKLPYLAYQQDQRAWDDGLTGLHEAEAGADHFIDVASRRQALASARRFSPAEGGVILEVGMSSGWLLPLLKREFPSALVIGSDSFPDALRRFAAREPGLPLLQFDLAACPLPDASVDTVVLLNVLEHVEDHARAMAEIARILKPGGAAVIEVPAGPGLYDIYDELLRHYRRYGMGQLRGLAEGAGLKVAWRSHLGFFLYPAFALVKLLNRRRMRQGAAAKSAGVAAQISRSRRQPLFDALMRLEFGLNRLLPLPFGIRCLMVAVKP
jgi:SAM-dependent methyltransferase